MPWPNISLAGKKMQCRPLSGLVESPPSGRNADSSCPDGVDTWSRASLMTFAGGVLPHSITNNADVRAGAVRLSLQARYVLPTTSGLSVVFRAGPDLYLAGIRSRAFLEFDGSEYMTIDSQADGTGLGF